MIGGRKFSKGDPLKKSALLLVCGDLFFFSVLFNIILFSVFFFLLLYFLFSFFFFSFLLFSTSPCDKKASHCDAGRFPEEEEWVVALKRDTKNLKTRCAVRSPADPRYREKTARNASAVIFVR